MKPNDCILRCLSILLLLTSIAAASPPVDAESSHFGILRDSAWSADGTHFLIVTASGAQVYRWDGSSLTLQTSLFSTRHPRCGVLNADGSQVLLGTEEGIIEQWETASGNLTTQWKAHRLPILDLSLHQDNTRLLSIGWRSNAFIWNTSDNTLQTTLETSTFGAETGHFLPDGSAVLWSKEFNLQIFDSETGALLGSRATRPFLHTAVFSPDGSLLAGVYAGQAQILQSLSGRLLQALNADFAIKQIAISPDHSSAALLGEAGQYLLYDLTSGALLEQWMPNPGSLYYHIIFSPSNQQLFLLGNAISTRDLRTLGFFSQFHITGRADAYTVSPDGQTLASRVDKLNYIEIWENGIDQPTQTLTNFPVPVMDAQFLSDGRLVVSADSLTFWDTDTAEVSEEWQIPLPEGTENFAVWVYDPDSQQSQQVKLDHLPLGRIGISDDAGWIAAEGMDGSLYTWRADTPPTSPISFSLGDQNSAKTMKSQVNAIVFSADNTQVLVWRNDDTIQVFDLATQTETTAFTLPSGTPAFEETCLRQWDSARQIFRLADSRSQFEINPADGSMTQVHNGICGFNGTDFVIEDDQIHLTDGTLSITGSQKETAPQWYQPGNDLLIYQNGRFSNFDVFVRHADANSQQQDVFTTLTTSDYLGSLIKDSYYNFTDQTVSWIDAQGKVYRGGSLQTAFGFSPASAAFSNDGRLLLIAGFDGSVILQTDSAAIPLVNAPARPQIFRALAFNPAGSHKAAGNDAGMVMIWDENNNAIQVETSGGAVQELTFSPDGQYLAVRGSDFISIWQLMADGNQPVMLQTTPRGSAMAFSPDGNFLVTSTRDGFATPLVVWRFPALEPQSRYTVPAAARIVFSSTTQFFLQSDQLWHCTLGENCRTMEVPETFTTGNLFIAVDTTKAVLITIDGRVVEVTLSE